MVVRREGVSEDHGGLSQRMKVYKQLKIKAEESTNIATAQHSLQVHA